MTDTTRTYNDTLDSVRPLDAWQMVTLRYEPCENDQPGQISRERRLQLIEAARTVILTEGPDVIRAMISRADLVAVEARREARMLDTAISDDGISWRLRYNRLHQDWYSLANTLEESLALTGQLPAGGWPQTA